MAFYLFPGVMYERLRRANHKYPAICRGVVLLSLQKTYQTYKLSTKQYLGFGSLLQFIPGTNANNAREKLSNELKPVMNIMIEELAKRLAWFDGELILFKTYSYLYPLYSYLNIGPFFKFLNDVLYGFDKPGVEQNRNMPLIRLIFMLPILIDIFEFDASEKIRLQQNALTNIIHTVLNPVRLIDNVLVFLHQGINRILNIGSERYDYSSLLRILLKSIPALFFGFVKIPVKALKHTIDILLEVVKVLTIDPLVHIGSSIKVSYQKSKEKALKEEEIIFTATVKQLRNIKELRRTAKGRDDTSYTAITKAISGDSVEYIDISKEYLYQNKDTDPSRWITIKGPAKNIARMQRLLDIVIRYGTDTRRAKDVEEAVDAAKDIISPRFGCSG
ncbi:MAG: hypothetical protein Q8M03_04480 [Legionella sp.]|nr:hypothetical protein [Legionella sp.]